MYCWGFLNKIPNHLQQASTIWSQLQPFKPASPCRVQFTEQGPIQAYFKEPDRVRIWPGGTNAKWRRPQKMKTTSKTNEDDLKKNLKKWLWHNSKLPLLLLNNGKNPTFEVTMEASSTWRLIGTLTESSCKERASLCLIMVTSWKFKFYEQISNMQLKILSARTFKILLIAYLISVIFENSWISLVIDCLRILWGHIGESKRGWGDTVLESKFFASALK